MYQRIAHIALVVDNYDDAIDFYRNMLDFVLVEDTQLGEKRWVMMSPPGAKECSLVLVRAEGKAQASRIGDQTGGRVFLFLFTDNFQRDYDNYTSRGGEICTLP